MYLFIYLFTTFVYCLLHLRKLLILNNSFHSIIHINHTHKPKGEMNGKGRNPDSKQSFVVLDNGHLITRESGCSSDSSIEEEPKSNWLQLSLGSWPFYLTFPSVLADQGLKWLTGIQI